MHETPILAEALFDCTFESSPLPMAVLGPDSRLLRVNAATCRLLGYAPDELVALPPHALSAEEDRAEDEAQRRRLVAGAAAAYTRVKAWRRRDGGLVWGRLHCAIARGGAGEPARFVVQVEPLAEPAGGRGQDGQRQLREQALMLDHARDAIVLHDAAGRIRFWSRGAELMFGFAASQAIGRSFEELLGPGAAADAAARERLASDGEWTGVLDCLSASGKVVTVERRCTLVGGGAPGDVLCVDTDITERQRADKEIVLLNNLLEQRIRSRTEQLQESNDDLRGLAYSLAHDLRAPLSSVDVFTAQLQQRLAGRLDEKCEHYLRRVRAGIVLMSELTEGLLALANLSSAPLLHHSVDLSALAAAAIERLREREPARRVAVTIHETRRAEGDVRLLTDVMENLLGNAWKFTSRTAHARIEFGGEPASDGSYRYVVRDNGAGFDPAYAYKLFNPFQRLHTPQEFEGTGIGLAIVRKIVSRHHGSIWAESRPGAGAAFYFTLGGRRRGPAGPLPPPAPARGAHDA